MPLRQFRWAQQHTLPHGSALHLCMAPHREVQGMVLGLALHITKGIVPGLASSTPSSLLSFVLCRAAGTEDDQGCCLGCRSDPHDTARPP